MGAPKRREEGTRRENERQSVRRGQEPWSHRDGRERWKIGVSLSEGFEHGDSALELKRYGDG